MLGGEILKKLYPTLGVLCLFYPVMCWILYIAYSNSPKQTDYMGVVIDNSLNNWLLTTAYEHLVNGGVIALFLVASGVFFYLSVRDRFEF